MQMRIKKITLNQFKGVRHAEFDLSNKNTISGRNGSGKTTIADGHFWLWADKDYALNSNPEVRPIDMESSEPSVTELIEIDGVELEVRKFQQDARNKKQVEEGAPVRIRNMYEINGVPKSQTDFVSELTERGVDFDKFLLLSHIDIFTSQKSMDCRNILFGMVTEVTDKDIADSLGNCAEAAEKLSQYRPEEVMALAKRDKKSADEQLDAIPNQIIGLEKAKEDIDVAALDARRTALQAEIDELKSKAGKNTDADRERIIAQITSAESELKAIGAKANADRLDALTIANNAVSELEVESASIKAEIETGKDQIKRAMADRDGCEREYKKLADRYAEVKAQIFSADNCAYCGQPLPQDKLDELRNDFIKKNTEEKAWISSKAQEIKDQIAKDEEVVHKVTAEVKDLYKKQDDIEKRLSEARERRDLYVEPVDVSTTTEYKTAWDKLQSLKADLEQLSAQSNDAWEINEELVRKGHEMKDLNDRIARAGVNDKIDMQITELKTKQKEVAQDKANAEKILYQMSLISMEKNKRLTEQVNSKFKNVMFKLFDQQKNGEYKDCCIPMINGKVFVVSANTALTMKGQLDIIDGLSRFYYQNYPVFVDGAEQFDDNNLANIKMDNQMVYLCVNNDDLKVREI